MSDSQDAARRPDAGIYRERDEGTTNGRSVREKRGWDGGLLVLAAAGPAPEEVRESYLTVRRAGSRELVTAIEVLSPSNKAPGAGRDLYLKKRNDTFASLTNLVEIDLIRVGERMPAFLEDWPKDAPPPGDYRILIARGNRQPLADLYVFGVRDRLPTIPVPLEPRVEEPKLDLQEIMTAQYDTFKYGAQIDYRREPVPPLSPDDAEWADRLLREAGRR
jgi:hypothetical protein